MGNCCYRDDKKEEKKNNTNNKEGNSTAINIKLIESLTSSSFRSPLNSDRILTGEPQQGKPRVISKNDLDNKNGIQQAPKITISHIQREEELKNEVPQNEKHLNEESAEGSTLRYKREVQVPLQEFEIIEEDEVVMETLYTHKSRNGDDEFSIDIEDLSDLNDSYEQDQQENSIKSENQKIPSKFLSQNQFSGTQEIKNNNKYLDFDEDDDQQQTQAQFQENVQSGHSHEEILKTSDSEIDEFSSELNLKLRQSLIKSNVLPENTYPTKKYKIKQEIKPLNLKSIIRDQVISQNSLSHKSTSTQGIVLTPILSPRERYFTQEQSKKRLEGNCSSSSSNTTNQINNLLDNSNHDINNQDGQSPKSLEKELMSGSSSKDSPQKLQNSNINQERAQTQRKRLFKYFSTGFLTNSIFTRSADNTPRLEYQQSLNNQNLIQTNQFNNIEQQGITSPQNVYPLSIFSTNSSEQDNIYIKLESSQSIQQPSQDQTLWSSQGNIHQIITPKKIEVPLSIFQSVKQRKKQEDTSQK